MLRSTLFLRKGCVKTYLLKIPLTQPPHTHYSDVQEGFPPRLAGVRGPFWGWFHSASLKTKTQNLGQAELSSPTKEVEYQKGGGGGGLRLLNPHIELGLPSNKLEFKLVSSYLCSHGYCHEQCSGSCTNQHKGPRRDIFKIPRQKTIRRKYERYTWYTCLPLQPFTPLESTQSSPLLGMERCQPGE